MYKYLLGNIDMCIPFIRPETIKFCKGKDGRVKITVPAKLSGEPTNIITIKLYIKDVRIVTQEQDLTIVVNPDPKECDELWIGCEGNGVAVTIGSPQNGK